MINNDTIQKFEKISNIDLTNFLQSSQRFFKVAFPEIQKFYSGSISKIDKKYFTALDNLEVESTRILRFFKERKNSLDGIDFWDLLDTLEDIRTALQRTQKISKYLRSSIVKGRVQSGFVFKYQMSANETLEDVARNILGDKDFQNTAQSIAVDNDLREVDWNMDGETELELRSNIFQNDLVTSMIDNTIGEKIYGLDLNKNITLKDDDLEVLGYRDTVDQTVETLATLSKGDIPEFPSLGLNGSIYKGENFSQMNYPSIVREMTRTFNTDDLFKDFNVTGIKYEDGDLFINYEVNTKYNLLIIKTASI